MNYKTLRHKLCEQRQALSTACIQKHSEEISKKLFNLPEFKKAKTIGAYMAHNGEIETKNIIKHCWWEKKQVYLPSLLPGLQMKFYEYNQGDKLIKNRFDILEPSPTSPINPVEFDVVLVPMVAFDQFGHRLGFGAGYYDRHFEFLQKSSNSFTKPLLIGLAHSFQEIEKLESNLWDIDMNIIITETDLKKFS